MISGQVRKNQLYENLEFFVQDVGDVDVDKLIERLEKG